MTNFGKSAYRTYSDISICNRSAGYALVITDRNDKIVHSQCGEIGWC